MIKEETIPFWRDKIDIINNTVLELLGERIIAVCEIGKIKKKNDMPISVPSREKDILDSLVAKNNSGLDDEAVRNIFEVIINENKRLEGRVKIES